MIDLHVHTNVSDDSFSIEEVIKKAKNDGVAHLAVTDHDTTKGIAEAAKLGWKMGVTVIPGIEVVHPLHTEKDRRLALEYAWKYGLYVTGGSDFHGFYDEVPIELGCRELNAEWFTALASRERNKRYEQG